MQSGFDIVAILTKTTILMDFRNPRLLAFHVYHFLGMPCCWARVNSLSSNVVIPCDPRYF